jgi:hypothetical protein
VASFSTVRFPRTPGTRGRGALPERQRAVGDLNFSHSSPDGLCERLAPWEQLFGQRGGRRYANLGSAGPRPDLGSSAVLCRDQQEGWRRTSAQQRGSTPSRA